MCNREKKDTKGNELAYWDESVNFTGDNGEYKEIGCNHFE